jgi:hypothetical protein
MQPFFPGPLSHRGASLGEATDAPGEFGQPVAIPEVTDPDQTTSLASIGADVRKVLDEARRVVAARGDDSPAAHRRR